MGQSFAKLGSNNWTWRPSTIKPWNLCGGIFELDSLKIPSSERILLYSNPHSWAKGKPNQQD